MDRYQKRILKLRNHVLSHIKEEMPDKNFVENIEIAHELAIDENEEREVENQATEQSKSEVNEDSNVIAYEGMTKAEIGELLVEKGIEYNPRDNKGKLIELLLGSE